MKMRFSIGALTALSVFVLTACDTANDDQRAVGQLESDRIEITAEVSEPILNRAVMEGQTVEAGQVLIEQDTGRVEARIAEAEAAEMQAKARLDELIRGPRREQIVAAQADVRGAERALEYRVKEFERAEQVYERNLASPELLDRTVAAKDAAEADLDSARARLEELLSGTTPEELRQAEEAVRQADARLTSLKIDFDRHHSSAPVAGVVDSLLFEQGERPAVGQPMAILLSGTQSHARIFVPESLRVLIVPGTAAKIFVDGIDQPLNGRVRWISSESAFTPYFALTEHDRGRLSYAAKVDILNAGSRLPDGVPVEVELLPGQVVE